MTTRTKRKPRGPAAVSVGPETEYTDYHGFLKLFGVRRSTLSHVMETEPALKGASISLKGKDEVRGKRLYNVTIFRRWLESRAIASQAEGPK